MMETSPEATLSRRKPNELAAAPFASGVPTVRWLDVWLGGVHDGDARGDPCAELGAVQAVNAGTSDCCGSLLVEGGVDRLGRDDVQYGEPGDSVGMVERQPPGDACTSVVSDHGEAIKPEPFHQLDLVLGHDTLRVRLMTFVGRGLGTVAVATQI
jgi:hypothetical protein